MNPFKINDHRTSFGTSQLGSGKQERYFLFRSISTSSISPEQPQLRDQRIEEELANGVAVAG